MLHVPEEKRGKKINVIQVDIYELIYHVSQHDIDKCLEDCWGVGQPKQHDQIFKVPPGGHRRSRALYTVTVYFSKYTLSKF